MNKFAFLEKIASIARIGINYTNNYFDRNRYEQMLEACQQEYVDITGLDRVYFETFFKKEFGYITPKVGVNAIIFNELGDVLLEQRSDDYTWGLPGGWSDMGESPQTCVIREVKEETGYEIEILQLIDVFWRVPSQNYPFTSYHLGYHCKIIGGTKKVSPESLCVDFMNINNVNNWHKDHFDFVKKTIAILSETKNKN